MTDVRSPAGRPIPHIDLQHDKAAAASPDVPYIPSWFTDWAFLPAAISGLIILAGVAGFGRAHGASYGWALFVTAACVIASWWWAGYDRRCQAARTRREQALCSLLEMSKVDLMTGRQFEEYCVELLRLLGYRDIIRVGDIKGRQDVDIIATAPDGTWVAVECKRLKGSVVPKIVNTLAGATLSGPYGGRKGILMSSARASELAHATARRNNIEIIDRPRLQELMSQAREAIGQRSGLSRIDQLLDGVEAGRPVAQVLTDLVRSFIDGLRLPARVAAVVLPGAAIALTAVVLLAPDVPSRPAAWVRPEASAAAGPVVRAFFAAISRHDWHEVWQLGGKDLGRGPYATYSGMISGYRLTARDVVTAFRARGNLVTGRVLAYETTGAVQSYQFTYTVRGGAIVAGRQTLGEPPGATTTGRGSAAGRATS